ncbi:MAG: hypothetical protein EPO40_08495 [Myxococcaceae bacterium]|nr:MAG: hypothetical protein EPO40_08495 [Myxococcaceae bacterium]
MKTDLRSSLLLMVSAALGGGSLAGCASTPAPVAATPAPGAMHGNGQAGSCGAAMSTPMPATPATDGGQAASCGATGSCGATRPAAPSGGGH